jgi:putative ABC transport system permease protein
VSLLRLITKSLLFHARMHLAVALGIAAATAVLTGALLVGDSVRGSLRHLALDRLGKIDEVLIADRFFRQELASEVLHDYMIESHQWQTVPAIVIPSATVETQGEDSVRRSSGVTLIACPSEFWDLGREATRPAKMPQGSGVVLNSPLAEELGVKAGDTLIVRLAKAAQVPADSALGRKTDRITSLADLKVAAVVPAKSLGRFAIHPAQSTPRNIYVPLPLVQEALQVPGQINCILAGRGEFDLPGDDEQTSPALHAALKPRLSDYGLSLDEIRIRSSDENAPDVAHYFSLTSDRMLLDDVMSDAAR